jgi:transaldolase/glucose-6-phosphate isomerase
VIFTAELGGYQTLVDGALAAMEAQHIVPRIWQHDHTVWSHDPQEISNRLGWLHIAEAMPNELPGVEELADRLRGERFTDVVLLGMGGSSLAPEVFRQVFGVAQGYLDLTVLDSTDPGAVLALAQRIEPARTIFIVSTKSGGTTETLSFFRFFYNWVAERIGQDNAGGHFVAITDAGSLLTQLVEACRFRAIFLNDPNIGGRYSALSHFGLAPAALLGLDLRKLLSRAAAMGGLCQPALAAAHNPGARLGAILGELALAGRDKLTLITTPALSPFGSWVEQLIAESTGKPTATTACSLS